MLDDFIDEFGIDRFRPLRGLRISQYYEPETEAEWYNGFRPLRGLRISQCEGKVVDVIQIGRFRPLRGLRISQSKMPDLCGFTKVSVPCGVFVFLNKKPVKSTFLRLCFRPLRGLRISQ